MDRRGDKPVTLETLSDDVARLCRYVESLQRSAELLARRLTPFEGEEKWEPAERQWLATTEELFRRKPKGDPDTIARVIRQATLQVEDATRDFGAMRAKVEAIASDSYLTADWKEWLAKGRPERD